MIHLLVVVLCFVTELQNVMYVFLQKCDKFRHLNRRKYAHKIASRVRHDQIEAYLIDYIFSKEILGDWYLRDHLFSKNVNLIQSSGLWVGCPNALAWPPHQQISLHYAISSLRG